MKTNWGVFFDLDQTLVLTDELEYLRRKRAWNQIYECLFKTILPPGTQQFIGSVSKIATVGVITSSPRQYAEKVLQYHALDIPVLVAYHDTARRKPNPDPILKAAMDSGLHPSNCFYIGDHPHDIDATLRAGATPIGIDWDESSTLRASHLDCVICSDWDEVYRTLSEHMI